MLHLPGHAPRVQVCKADELIEHAFDAELVARWKRLWSDLCESPIGRPRRRPFCACTSDDIRSLLENGIIERSESSSHPNTSVFRVDEPLKQRARIITWTHSINDSVPYEASKFLGITHSAMKIAQCKNRRLHCFCVDLKAAFYQMSIPKHARGRFTFSVDGELFEFTRLPMGARPSAEICGMLLQALIDHASKTSQVFPIVATHIDNARFMSSDTVSLERFRQQLVASATLFNITIGEITEISTECDFCGLHYDIPKQQVSLLPSKREKILLTLSQVGTLNPIELTKFVCKLVHYINVLKIPLTNFPALIHILSRASLSWAGKLSRSDLSWAIPEIELAAKMITRENYAVAFDLAAPEEAFIAVDATPRTTAVVTIIDGARYVKVEPVHGKKSINESELMAILRALKNIGPRLRFRTVTIVSDSAVAQAVLRSGTSTQERLTRIAARIVTHCEKFMIRLNVVHIPTSINPADGPSRGRLDIDWDKVQCIEEIYKSKGTP